MHNERETRQLAGVIVILIGVVAAALATAWTLNGAAPEEFGSAAALWEIREAGRQLLGWLAVGLGLIVILVGVVVVITAPAKKAVER